MCIKNIWSNINKDNYAPRVCHLSLYFPNCTFPLLVWCLDWRESFYLSLLNTSLLEDLFPWLSFHFKLLFSSNVLYAIIWKIGKFMFLGNVIGRILKCSPSPPNPTWDAWPTEFTSLLSVIQLTLIQVLLWRDFADVIKVPNQLILN